MTKNKELEARIACLESDVRRPQMEVTERGIILSSMRDRHCLDKEHIDGVQPSSEQQGPR